VLVRGRRRAGDRLLASDRQTVVVDLCLIRLGELVRARWQRLIDLPLLLLGLYAVAAAVAGTPRLQHLGEPKLERRQFDGFSLALLVACRQTKAGLLVIARDSRVFHPVRFVSTEDSLQGERTSPKRNGKAGRHS